MKKIVPSSSFTFRFIFRFIFCLGICSYLESVFSLVCSSNFVLVVLLRDNVYYTFVAFCIRVKTWFAGEGVESTDVQSNHGFLVTSFTTTPTAGVVGAVGTTDTFAAAF
jgi:hypothetical protein